MPHFAIASPSKVAPTAMAALAIFIPEDAACSVSLRGILGKTSLPGLAPLGWLSGVTIAAITAAVSSAGICMSKDSGCNRWAFPSCDRAYCLAVNAGVASCTSLVVDHSHDSPAPSQVL